MLHVVMSMCILSSAIWITTAHYYAFCFVLCLKFKLKKVKIDATPIFNKGSSMTICLGKSCLFGLLFGSLTMCVLLSRLVLRVGCGI